MKKENWVKDEKKFYRIVYLISSILLLCAFLNYFFMNSNLGASLYIGFCFFITILSINKKAFKQQKTEES